ncbi:MAG: C-terminal helicase domain-containing protein, partial [Nitrospirota bacterium]
DKRTMHGPKIEELEILLREIVIEGGEKVVIFSQWLRMTELVEQILKRNEIKYVHLNGSIPSRNRKNLMSKFKEDPKCMVFLSTDAGGVGLNLQSGSVVINMDMPWNPAVLEQRIGRVHRLGQRKTVRVINFVTAGSIEERILSLLKFKKSLFAGALDSDGENVVMIGESQFKRFIKSVEAVTENLERADPEKEKLKEAEEKEDSKAANIMDAVGVLAGKVEIAGESERKNIESLNKLLMSGARFLTDLSKAISQPAQTAAPALDSHFAAMIGKDDKTGKSYLKIPLPETEVLKNIFSTFGELLANTLRKSCEK